MKSITLGAQPLHPDLTVRSSLLKWQGTKPRHAFTARNAAEARSWQARARKAFINCLGDEPPPSDTPLRVRVLERAELDGYTRTLFTLDTAKNIKALCWLCVPEGVNVKASASPVPAMIATPGHGIGAKDLLALDAKGKPRKEGDGYQKDYALQAVRLGYPTLVIEPMAFGERRDSDHMAGKSNESPCQAGSTVAMMLGTTLARIRMNDIQRGLDYLGTLPGIDAKRVGLMGISGGGQMTLWTAAADPRFKVAIVSGYFNTFRHSVMGMHHCICNFAPGLARDFDMADLAALVAPRAMLTESGTKDPIFPIKATRAALTHTRAIYKTFGAAERIDSDIFVADHQWSGKKLAPFLKKWL